MADFSVKATELSAPQGAGSQPVQAVQQQYLNTSAINMPIVDSVVDVFQRGLVQTRKDAAKSMENEVVNRFAKDEAALNDAFASGQITASEFSIRSRANFTKYVGSYGQYADKIEGVAKALKGYSEKGVVEDRLEEQKALRRSALTDAQGKGYYLDGNMTPAEQDVIIRASASQKRAEDALAAQYKASAEARAVKSARQSDTQFENALEDRQVKEVARQQLVGIASDNMAAFDAIGQSLVRDVRAGLKTPQEAQSVFQSQFGRIQSALVAASSTNPDMVGMYRSLFNESREVYMKMLDPKANLEELENQVKSITSRAQLAALQADQGFANAVGVSQLLGNNPLVALEANRTVPGVLAKMSQTPSTGQAPQVVGNADVEPGVLNILKKSVQTLPLTKDDKASVEAATSINHILKQTSVFLDRGANADNLKGLATFFSSPEYARVVKSGTIDQQAAGAAAKTFQLAYEPAVGTAVQEKLNGYLYQQRSNTNAPTTLAESLDIQFNGSGITFVPKNMANLDANERASQQDAVRALQPSARAITQLIQISAHLNGSTDYAAEFEKRKHIWLPKMYSPYTNLNIGDVKSGMRYTGGDSKDPANWTAVNGR